MNSTNTTTKIAVWDTFALKADGSVMHFDILVPTSVTDPQKIFEYGSQYLDKRGELSSKIDAAHCQFCHVEASTVDIEQAIKEKGYYILEMEDIPGELAEYPSRRDLVLFLKAHFEKFRFANFSGISIEEIQLLLYHERQQITNTEE